MSVDSWAMGSSMRRFRERMRELIDSTSGTALIEAALVAPVLATVILGTVDLANYGAARLTVQQAINRGLEMAMIGGPTTSTTSIRDETAAQAGVASGQVTVTQSQTCNGSTATWGNTCSSGELRQFIQIDVTQTFTPTFAGGSVARVLTSNGTISISATGVIRIQ